MVAKQFDDAGDIDASIPLIEEDRIAVGSRLLRAALDLYRLTRSGANRSQAVEKMREHPTRYDTRILDAFDHVTVTLPEIVVRVLPIVKLKPGMLLDDAVTTTDGLLIASEGRHLSPATLERLARFEKEGRIQPEIQVRIPRVMLED